MHRMPATAVKEEENRQQARKKARHVPRTADSVRQARVQEITNPASRETLRVEQTVLRAEDRRVIVRKEEETATVTEEASKEEETAATVLAATVPRMVRDVRQDRARETEVHVRMTEEAETVSAVEQTVARGEARADVPKAEEAETTVSAEQTVVARAADSVRDREEAVALQMLYSLRS